MIKRGRVLDDADVLQIIEEDQSAELGLIAFLRLRQSHIKLSRRRALHQNSVVVHHAPDESGTIEALQSG